MTVSSCLAAGPLSCLVAAGSLQPSEAAGAVSAAEPDQAQPRLSALWVYPIKSCAGCSVQRWALGPNGLLLDREWALIGPQGSALTQKAVPALAAVTPRLDLAAGVSPRCARLHCNGHCRCRLRLAAACMGSAWLQAGCKM